MFSLLNLPSNIAFTPDTDVNAVASPLDTDLQDLADFATEFRSRLEFNGTTEVHYEIPDGQALPLSGTILPPVDVPAEWRTRAETESPQGIAVDIETLPALEPPDLRPATGPAEMVAANIPQAPAAQGRPQQRTDQDLWQGPVTRPQPVQQDALLTASRVPVTSTVADSGALPANTAVVPFLQDLPVSERPQSRVRPVSGPALQADVVSRVVELSPGSTPVTEAEGAGLVATRVLPALPEKPVLSSTGGQTPDAGARAIEQLSMSFQQGNAVLSSQPRTTEAVTYRTSVEVPVNTPEWAEKLGERVLFMTGNKRQSAEIRLTPAELGPVRVRISMEEGSTSVAFQATHAATRDALESAMPRLREMLAEQGLTLGQASVDDRGQRHGLRDDASPAAPPDARAAAEEADVEQQHEVPVRAIAANSLVDTFV